VKLFVDSIAIFDVLSLSLAIAGAFTSDQNIERRAASGCRMRMSKIRRQGLRARNRMRIARRTCVNTVR
jgi:hypothetical protein